MKKLVFSAFLLLSLSACSTTQVAENSCIFVHSAYDSAEKRQNDERDNDDTVTHIINGLGAILFNSLFDFSHECSE